MREYAKASIQSFSGRRFWAAFSKIYLNNGKSVCYNDDIKYGTVDYEISLF